MHVLVMRYELDLKSSFHFDDVILGYPEWPAMVDCDSTGRYADYDERTGEVLRYFVVFLDPQTPTRQRIQAAKIRKFISSAEVKQTRTWARYYTRLVLAAREAENALTLPLEERIFKYGFPYTEESPDELKNKYKKAMTNAVTLNSQNGKPQMYRGQTTLESQTASIQSREMSSFSSGEQQKSNRDQILHIRKTTVEPDSGAISNSVSGKSVGIKRPAKMPLVSAKRTNKNDNNNESMTTTDEIRSDMDKNNIHRSRSIGSIATNVEHHHHNYSPVPNTDAQPSSPGGNEKPALAHKDTQCVITPELIFSSQSSSHGETDALDSLNLLKTEDAYEQYLGWKRTRRRSSYAFTACSKTQPVDFQDSVRALKALSRCMRRKALKNNRNSEVEVNNPNDTLPGYPEWPAMVYYNANGRYAEYDSITRQVSHYHVVFLDPTCSTTSRVAVNKVRTFHSVKELQHKRGTRINVYGYDYEKECCFRSPKLCPVKRSRGRPRHQLQPLENEVSSANLTRTECTQTDVALDEQMEKWPLSSTQWNANGRYHASRDPNTPVLTNGGSSCDAVRILTSSSAVNQASLQSPISSCPSPLFLQLPDDDQYLIAQDLSVRSNADSEKSLETILEPRKLEEPIHTYPQTIGAITDHLQLAFEELKCYALSTSRTTTGTDQFSPVVSLNTTGLKWSLSQVPFSSQLIPVRRG
ncbi:hypothetical protein FGIG_08294 [Fasciola gigantica]|uniref:PWWP domain-containing protein n=1 Tax=Fasciola gigantica TaxID=46835 RepID=A0A504XIR4_FASGI|nr:hypothetical protein FGIG_08294 [Fasciola gigantica]